MEAIEFIILQILFATQNWEISSDIPQISPNTGHVANIRARDAFRPIALEREYLMDYNSVGLQSEHAEIKAT